MLHGFWKVQDRFPRKCWAGVICYRLGPTLKSCRENHSEEERNEGEKKNKPNKTLPNTDYVNLENIGLNICEQQQNATIRAISHLLQKRKRTLSCAYPAIGSSSNTDFYLVSISL